MKTQFRDKSAANQLSDSAFPGRRKTQFELIKDQFRPKPANKRLSSKDFNNVNCGSGISL
jgi:hypothetical protein